MLEATDSDTKALLSLRDDAARWLLDRGIDQWQPGEIPYSWERVWSEPGETRLQRTEPRAARPVRIGGLPVGARPAIRVAGPLPCAFALREGLARRSPQLIPTQSSPSPEEPSPEELPEVLGGLLHTHDAARVLGAPPG